MAMDTTNDKYSVKNLLFYRAIPNYVVPENTEGHDTYACKDCGDRFILESSYQFHIQRKSVQITYKCRYCAKRIVFYNRCNLLSHIRSHTFKTATINVSDLKIDPLPLSFFKHIKNDELSGTLAVEKNNSISHICFECKKDITGPGPIHKDRANHYMEYTNEVYSCPVCLFTLPTKCGLKAHLRIHLRTPPYCCPECGINMPNKNNANVTYPFNHSCEGFNMMRATTRYSCPTSNCNFYHPNDFKKHMKEKHIKKIYSCPGCVVACFSESTMQKHLKTHETSFNALIFYQCELCPGRLVMQYHVDNHLNNHNGSYVVYPCWICSTVFKNIPDLIDHHMHHHDQNNELKSCLKSFNLKGAKRIYRVVKRCDQCLRSFTYKCHYRDINILPNVCPYKCSPSPSSTSILNCNTIETSDKKIKCPLCTEKISQNWEDIKKHYNLNHKDHRCIDARVLVSRVCIKKYLGCHKKKAKLTKRSIKKQLPKKDFKVTKRRGKTQKALKQSPSKSDESETVKSQMCLKCEDSYETKAELEAHIIAKHRDPCMAYQCMECGDCFVVKPSFSIHLRLHGISDIDEYINTKKCYNENANKKTVNEVLEEPLNENQCKICREQFDNTDDLEKHFRVHGMAFLMKNSLNKA